MKILVMLKLIMGEQEWSKWKMIFVRNLFALIQGGYKLHTNLSYASLTKLLSELKALKMMRFYSPLKLNSRIHTMKVMNINNVELMITFIMAVHFLIFPAYHGLNW